MRRFVVPLILLFVLPTYPSEADTASVNLHSHKSLMKQPDPVEIPYVFTKLIKLILKSGPIREYTIDHSTKPVQKEGFSFISIAEAADSVLTVDYLEQLLNAVNKATALHELQPVLSAPNFQLLKTKEKEGISQYTILATIQSMRPQNIRVLDSKIEEGRATAVVTGRSQFGPMPGVIHLVKDDGLWKIEREEWQAAQSQLSVHNFLSPRAFREDTKRAGLIAQVSPDVQVNRNMLSLTKVPFNKDKRAIMFVFLMNKSKSDLRKAKILPGENVAQDKRGYMHIMWTGSKKIVRDQSLFQDGYYPADVSLAHYDDGFAAGEWNMVLPRKRPREVKMALLWSF
jgi:hypothetical protein